MGACVYILQFRRTGRYYIGSTDNLERRLVQHKHGHTPSTRRLGEFHLVFSQEVPDIKVARYTEKRIKSWKRKDFIEKIVRDGKISFLSDKENQAGFV